MNPVLKEILDTKSVQAADGTVLPVHSQIPSADGEFLQKLILRLRPQTSLEIGLAYGISSLYMCEALAQVGAQRHFVVDPIQNGQRPGQNLQYDKSNWSKLAWTPETGWRGIGLRNLQRAGYGNLVDLIEQPSHAALPALLARGEKIDFAFIDGWHTFDYVLVEFFYIDLLLQVGGVVAFDDSNYPAIRKVLRYVLANRRYSVVPEQKAAAHAASVLRRTAARLGSRSPRLRRAMAPELVQADVELGLPPGRCIALRKDGDDILGDGSGVSRSWNFHKPF